jgi:hypothetical protein
MLGGAEGRQAHGRHEREEGETFKDTVEQKKP